MNYTLEEEKFFSQLSSVIQIWFLPSKANQNTPRLLTTNMCLYVVVFVVMIKLIGTAIHIPFPQNIFFADITKTDLFNLVNSNRVAQGLKPLAEDPILDQAAYLKAQDMIKKGYFAHQSPSGTTPWFWFLVAGYKYAYAGENLAVGFINSPDVFDAWRRSPSHWANIINPHYKEMGLAIVPGFGENDSLVVVQLFGSQTSATPPTTTQKPKTVKPTETAQKHQELPAPEVTSTPGDSRVLAEATENVAYTAKGSNTSSSLYIKILNAVIYDNSTGISYAIYALLLIIGGCVLGYVGFSAGEINRRLILKSLALMVILSASLLINQATLANLIGHHVII